MLEHRYAISAVLDRTVEVCLVQVARIVVQEHTAAVMDALIARIAQQEALQHRLALQTALIVDMDMPVLLWDLPTILVLSVLRVPPLAMVLPLARYALQDITVLLLDPLLAPLAQREVIPTYTVRQHAHCVLQERTVPFKVQILLLFAQTAVLDHTKQIMVPITAINVVVAVTVPLWVPLTRLFARNVLQELTQIQMD